MATTDMSMAVNIPPTAPPHVYAAAAEQCLQWGRPDGALQVSELGLQRHPTYTGLKLFRAEALLLHRKLDRSEEDLRAVLAAEPLHPRAIKILAHLLMEQHRFAEAVPILERAEFILMNDPDIPGWLQAAEQGLEDERNAPPPAYDFLYSEETSARLSEFTEVPGVQALCILDEFNARYAGPDHDRHKRTLDSMSSLERCMSEVLHDAGFGAFHEAIVHTPDAVLAACKGTQATVRAVADPRVREGLVAWHCKKTLGEDPE